MKKEQEDVPKRNDGDFIQVFGKARTDDALGSNSINRLASAKLVAPTAKEILSNKRRRLRKTGTVDINLTQIQEDQKQTSEIAKNYTDVLKNKF